MITNLSNRQTTVLLLILGLFFFTACTEKKGEDKKGKTLVEWRKDEFNRDVLHYEGESGIIDITIKPGLVTISGKNYGALKAQLQVDIINAVLNVNSSSTKHRVINAMGLLVNNPTAFPIGNSLTLALDIPSLTGKENDEEDDDDDYIPSGGEGGGGGGGFNIPGFSADGNNGIPSVGESSDQICLSVGSDIMRNTGGLVTSPGPGAGWQIYSHNRNLSKYDQEKGTGYLTFGKEEKNEKGEWRATHTGRTVEDFEVVSEATSIVVIHEDGSKTSSMHSEATSGNQTVETTTFTKGDVVTSETKVNGEITETKVTEGGNVVHHTKDGQAQPGHNPDYQYVSPGQLQEDNGHVDKDEDEENDDDDSSNDHAGNGGSEPATPSEPGTGGGTICYPSWMVNQMINWNRLGEAVTDPVPHEAGSDGTDSGSGPGLGSLILPGEESMDPGFTPDASMILDKRIWITDPQPHEL
jgi:hypothetical protein